MGETLSPPPPAEKLDFGSLETLLRIIATKNFTPVDSDYEDITTKQIRAKLRVFPLNKDPNIQKRQNLKALDRFLAEYLPKAKLEFLEKVGFANNPGQMSLDQIEDLNKKLRSISDEYLLNFAKTCFKAYLRQNRDPRWVLAQKGKETRFIGLKTRYSKSYQEKIIKRMRYLAATRGNQNAVLLTITLDPKLFRDKLEMWQIRKQQHRFMEGLRLIFKRQGRKFPDYLAAVESQKNGNPHLHILFFDCKRILDWRKIRDLWGLGHIFINRTPKGSKIKYPINYICKYITKTFTDNSKENNLTQSLAWFFGVRSYTYSPVAKYDKEGNLLRPGLIYPLNKKGPGGWRVDYLVVFVSKPIEREDFIKMGNGG
jgi:hypothetical protein